MASNRDKLVTTLESLPVLAGRYEQLKCVNYDLLTGNKRGCFSLVFSAVDMVVGRKVAIKFFDIDIAVLQNPYRIQAFEREPDILQTLIGRARCLQLIAGLEIFVLELRLPDGTLVGSIPCKYFVVEWIDRDIDEFFDRQDAYAPAEKLKLFNEIVLGVEALHRYEVHHRDLHPRNLRSYTEALNRIIVAIDLGTAARLSSPSLLANYGAPVGANEYSAPETFCGLSGNREIGRATDVYALGCLLYELFNEDLFFYAVTGAANYGAILAAMSLDLHGKKNDMDRMASWRSNMKRFAKAVPEVPIDGPGSSVPASLHSLLNDLVASLTHFDFEKRLTDLERVRRNVWSALKILQNEAKYLRHLARRRRVSDAKAAKIRRKEKRLTERLTAQAKLTC